MTDTYTCAICSRTFEKVQSDKEAAIVELHELFGEVPLEECDIVCDDCFEQIRPDKVDKIEIRREERMMKDKSNFVHWFIAALLVALLAGNVYFATLALQERRAQAEYIEERHAAYEEHVRQMQATLARQRQVIDGAFDSYHADAYESGVDRIAEQQLLAAEYQLLLLQVVTRQNAQMIELMMIKP